MLNLTRIPNKPMATIYDDFMTGGITTALLGTAGFRVVTTTGNAPVNPLVLYQAAVPGHPGVLGLKASFDGVAGYGDAWMQLNPYPGSDSSFDHAAVCAAKDVRRVALAFKTPADITTDLTNTGIQFGLQYADGNGTVQTDVYAGFGKTNFQLQIENNDTDMGVAIADSTWYMIEITINNDIVVASINGNYHTHGKLSNLNAMYVPGLYMGIFDAGAPSTLTLQIDEFLFQTADYVNRENG
jgi:hypothetical protein